MRASILVSVLLWSTLSGVLLGFLADALLVGVWTIVSALLHGWSPRLGGRAIGMVAGLVLTLPPLIGGILGYLEGQLKTR